MKTATNSDQQEAADKTQPIVQPLINIDTIGDIRTAVANVLRAHNVDADHKHITDAVVDELPDFFRYRLNNIDFQVGEIVSVDFEPEEGGDGSTMEVSIAVPRGRIGGGKIAWARVR